LDEKRRRALIREHGGLDALLGNLASVKQPKDAGELNNGRCGAGTMVRCHWQDPCVAIMLEPLSGSAGFARVRYSVSPASLGS